MMHYPECYMKKKEINDRVLAPSVRETAVEFPVESHQRS